MTRLLWMAVLLLPTARAHMPETLGPDVTVPDTRFSYAYMGEFATGEEVFVLRLPFAEDFASPYELLVPHRDRYREFRPMYALVAPGLPEATAEEEALLPLPIPEGYGLYLDLNDDPERVVIFESFFRDAYWSTGPVALITHAGEAQLWIWSPQGEPGEVVMAFGLEEGFGEVE